MAKVDGWEQSNGHGTEVSAPSSTSSDAQDATLSWQSQLYNATKEDVYSYCQEYTCRSSFAQTAETNAAIDAIRTAVATHAVVMYYKAG